MKTPAKSLLFSFCIIALLLSGCSSKKMALTDYNSYYAGESEASADLVYEEAMPVQDGLKKAKTKTSQTAVSKPAERMVHYNGYAKLKVVKPSETLDKASEIVISAGGYIEKRRERNAGFRIPVKKFQITYDKILALGIVLKKSVSAEDITDQYTDMALRLEVSKKSLQRYMELLAKTDDEEEKIRLLKEISRLNEAIESLENSVTVLSLLADFSRINLETMPYNQRPLRAKPTEIKAFRWINDLTPFSYEIAQKEKRLDFNVPEKLVLIKGDIWRTESADGTAFWAHKRTNDPAGDTDFWLNALKVRLAKAFSSSEVKSAGEFKYLRLTSLSDKPYTYYIGVKAEKKDLKVFEAYFPDADQEKAYCGAVIQALDKRSR